MLMAEVAASRDEDKAHRLGGKHWPSQTFNKRNKNRDVKGKNHSVGELKPKEINHDVPLVPKDKAPIETKGYSRRHKVTDHANKNVTTGSKDCEQCHKDHISERGV
jgi:hypothetical protein